MKSKLLKYIFLAMVIFTAFFLIVSIFISQKNIIQMKDVSVINQKSNFSFILRDCDGFLAVYRENESMPYLKLGYRTDFLNEYDREIIKKGITVNTSNELRCLIEDFTG